MIVQLRIRHKTTGNVEMIPQDRFDLLPNRDEWEVLEPEHQRTPAPAGQSIRASDLPGSIASVPVAPVDDQRDTSAGGRRRKRK